MRFIPAVIIALMGLGFSWFAKAAVGLPGALTKIHEKCIQQQSLDDQKATAAFLADVREISKLQYERKEVPEYLEKSRDIHQAEIDVQKIKCLSGVISGTATEPGILPNLTVKDIQKNLAYRMVISQLALYRGLKESELNNFATDADCNLKSLDHQLDCLAKKQKFFIQERSMLIAVSTFLEQYMAELDVKKNRYSSMSVLNSRSESAALKYLENLRAPKEEIGLESKTINSGAFR